jgi:hypothetical protein
MRSHELTRLAAATALHSAALLQSRIRFPDTALEVYWTASKCRQERWSRVLRRLGQGTVADDRLEITWEPVLDEILTSEVLSRVWAAICTGLDARRGKQEAGPIANSVMAGHFEARHRVLNLIVGGNSVAMEHAVMLNRRRLQNERWADMLLSLIATHHEVDGLAFDTRRVSEWARFWIPCGAASNGKAALSQALTALAASVRSSATELTGNEDLNRRIASSVLACLPPELFDSLGRPISNWQRSLLQVVSDSQGELNLEISPPPRQVTSDLGGWLLARHRRRT